MKQIVVLLRRVWESGRVVLLRNSHQYTDFDASVAKWLQREHGVRAIAFHSQACFYPAFVDFH